MSTPVVKKSSNEAMLGQELWEQGPFQSQVITENEMLPVVN
jgi:hypothetical protein